MDLNLDQQVELILHQGEDDDLALTNSIGTVLKKIAQIFPHTYYYVCVPMADSIAIETIENKSSPDLVIKVFYAFKTDVDAALFYENKYPVSVMKREPIIKLLFDKFIKFLMFLYKYKIRYI